MRLYSSTAFHLSFRGTPRRIVLTALGIRLDGDRVTAMVDPLTALLQVGLPEGPQLQPKPHRKWHRGEMMAQGPGTPAFHPLY